MANEKLLTKRVVFYIRQNYPDIPFRVDIVADLPLPQRHRSRLRELHGNNWTRGHPDLFIMSCRGKFGGLYIELKDTKSVPNTEHTRTQAKYHVALRRCGYKVLFCCGYDETIYTIDKYMKKKAKNV